MTSNQLGESLLSCPFHIAVVTGDACMLESDDFGARIAFVDYDGKKTFDDYKNNKPQNASDELEFVLRNAPLMVRSVDSLKKWIKCIKSD
jgi:aspartate aminotransferase